MSALHEAAQLALEALEYGQHSLKQVSEHQWESRGQLAMDALKAALAQLEPAQEPVATQQSEAMRLADSLRDGVPYDEAEIENELRRLHAENAELREANETFGKRQEWWNERMFVLEAQRDALLEALKEVTQILDMVLGVTGGYPPGADGPAVKARAAIKAVEEEEGWVATAREAQKHFDAELKRYEGEKK